MTCCYFCMLYGLTFTSEIEQVPAPQTLKPTRYILNPQLSTLNPKPQTQRPAPYTLNPEP